MATGNKRNQRSWIGPGVEPVADREPARVTDAPRGNGQCGDYGDDQCGFHRSSSMLTK